ncbi:M24 family metallopeptidase [Thalassobacillus devorans]|uniref:M24 family metallopeptidase n=1 Tax=Thalassobacillus devorans TaxID=279813 RepID=UPI00048D8E37|nr:Xaa-Pro peptidase family protein [Thalassobacillus devorans]
MKRRLQKVGQHLKEAGMDAAFINGKENFFYLSGFHTDPHERLIGLMVFPEAEPVAIVPAMESGQLRQTGWQYEVIGYADHEDPWAMLGDSLNEKGKTSLSVLGIEKDVLSYGRTESLLKLFPEQEIVDVSGILNEMRVIKDASEIDIIRRAAELADYGVKAGVEALQAGISEMEVLAKIEYELKKKGVREMSFSTMVLFGEKSGQPHGSPGDRKLQEGDFVLFDLGVVLEGYTSDITRTFVYQSANAKQKEIYETVLEAQKASLEISKPGSRIGDLDQTARNIIESAGYGDKFPHRIGHGMGISVHEFPSMSHLNDGKLKEGMVYTIEPGIYDPAIGGVRIEDDVLITKDGYETLTKFPKELQIIE